MIVKEGFIRKLKGFGLNSYEAKIWAALLSRGVSSAGELSDIANVPRSRSYDVLESLEKKGFVMMKPGKPLKYVALAPSEVLERVKKKVQEEAIEQEGMLNELKGSGLLKELNLLHKQGVELLEPSDMTGSVRGRTNLDNHMEMMINGAEHSLALMTTSQEITRFADVLINAFQKAKRKGVSIRICAPLTPESAPAMKRLTACCDVRPLKEVTARMCIVDGEEIVFMLLDDKDVHQSYDTGVWVNTGFFASTLLQMFDIAWEKAQPLLAAR
ncbi:hypothetical protein HZB01_01860 [Candidatus Woesearchaeota archaeon]|nr:hypothetical protein [Candidatus Woesearchaeota archaeon]